jgi:hypothetical protein
VAADLGRLTATPFGDADARAKLVTVAAPPESHPSDLTSARALLLAERAARLAAEDTAALAAIETANIKADLSAREALMAYQQLTIEKLRRELHG